MASRAVALGSVGASDPYPPPSLDGHGHAAWDERVAKEDARRAALLEQRAGALQAWEFGQVPDAAREKLKTWIEDQDTDFRVINDIDGNAYGKRWLKGQNGPYPYGGVRNAGIAAHCFEVMKAHPGKRLVVVIGAAHKAVLDELFRRTHRVRVLHWDRDVPAPTADAAQEALTDTDRVAILGHNLDGERYYFHRDLIDMDRMRVLLDELTASGHDHRVLVYFRARWYQHHGGTKAAQVLFDRLAAGSIVGPDGPAQLYPFPIDHWRMAYDLSQAVRLERARLRLHGDGAEEARAELRALAEERTIPEGPRDGVWRMQFLARAFPRFLARHEPGPAASVAGDPALGAWTGADPTHGPIEIERGDDGAVLRLPLRHPAGAGLPHLSRQFAAGEGAWTFSARLRGEGTSSLRVVAYVWPDGRRAKRIAEQEVAGDGAWHDVALRMDVPGGQEQVLLNVYAARTAEGSLSLSDATWSKAEAPPLRLRIMTFNLHWDGFEDGANAWVHRRALAVRVIDAFDPDSLGTQEPMKRQIADVKAALPRLDSFRFDNDPKYTRTHQILFRKDRFERIDGGGFLISDGVDGDGTVRYCTWVRLRERATGRTYRHYNVHLDHGSAPSRQQAAVRLMRHIAASPAGDPFVVTGDFNSGEKSPTMSYFFGERTLPEDGGVETQNPIPLVDTFRVLYPDEKEARTGCGFRDTRTKVQMIDHVLVAAGNAIVREAAIVRTTEDGRAPSDHCPVTAVVEWK